MVDNFWFGYNFVSIDTCKTFFPTQIDTVKAPKIVHLCILTSVGYSKKETSMKNCSQLNNVIIILYLHKVQNVKYFLDL